MTQSANDTAQIIQLKFTPIPIFSSNYVWLLGLPDSREVYVVDPGSAKEVQAYIKRHDLMLKGILITHSHNDHIGGVDDLLGYFDVPIYGPKCAAIPQVSIALNDGDTIDLWPGVRACTMHLPGHLPEHLAFFFEKIAPSPALLCGDIIFSSGCGRMFSGPAEVFQASLARIAGLPAETRLYCAHEYTLANIEFAKFIEPNNAALLEKEQQTHLQIHKRQCSLPTSVKNELETNPFLRTDNTELAQRLKELTGTRPKHEAEAFGLLRQLKDSF